MHLKPSPKLELHSPLCNKRFKGRYENEKAIRKTKDEWYKQW